MKKTMYVLGCLLAAAIIAGGCACYAAILEKYHALSSLDVATIQSGQIFYSITTVF